MKQRPEGFLSANHIDHDSEAFDYIRELHTYLWTFVRIYHPGASGDLADILDEALVGMKTNAEHHDKCIKSIGGLLIAHKSMNPKALTRHLQEFMILVDITSKK